MRDRSRDRRSRDWRHRDTTSRRLSPAPRRRRSPSPVVRRDRSRDRGVRKPSPVASSHRTRRDSPDRSIARKRGRDNMPPRGNIRIDRHECRKAAIEFLINHYDLPQHIPDLDELINSHIRTLDMDFDYYGFTVEILKGLLEDRKYTVITDRWIMGILDDHLQAELRVPDLSILRVAGYELLTHPEIPTTVVINEVNVLAKMYCPERQSLIHASVNRMIETQISIGNEIAAESGCLAKPDKPNDPLAALVGLDQQAQLAIILLEQRRRSKKLRHARNDPEHTPESSDHETGPSDVDEPMHAPVVHAKTEDTSEAMEIKTETGRKPHQGTAVLKINYAPVQTPTKIRVHASTQTVRDPTMEPGARVYRIIR